MRILAIRGANLTSLAGDFAVDFERAPLDRTGIFAITGPTGSGKTTLLDAMCLALFDRTPRFRERGGVGIGNPDLSDGERLLSNDVRNLLRKGAAAGHAEVVFLGRDGRRWIARWEVRRARGRTEGRLQEQALTLKDASTAQVVGRTKREVLQAIEERLGLSFEQFCRSVLLAQGDFAAFLLAREHERAELLERMTGTQIYAEVSRRCHERATQERTRLAELYERQRTVEALPLDERATLERAVGRVTAVVAEARTLLARVDAAIAWHRALAERTASLAAAAAALGRAEEAKANLASVAEEIAAVEQAQPLRELVRRHDEIRGAFAERDVRFGALSEAARTAAQTYEQANAALASAQGALLAAQTARADAEPALMRARLLDAELARLTAELANARADAEAARLAASREHAARVSLDDAVQAARRDHNSVEQWLQNNDAVRVLADGWPRWAEALDRARGAIEDVGAAGPALSQITVEVESATEALAALEATLRTLESNRERISAAHRIAALHAEKRPLRAAHQLEAAHLGRLATLRSAAERAERIVSARAREHAADEREESATARAGQAEQTEEAARRRAEEIAGEISVTAERLEEARGFASLHEHRVKLRRGRPCSLCGSVDHPFKQGSLPFPSTADDLALELHVLRQHATDTATAQTAAREQAYSSRQAAEQAVRERTETAAGRASEEERFREDWSVLADEVLPESPSAPGAVEELRARVISAETTAESLREEARLAEELEAEGDRLRAELDSAQAALERVRLSRDDASARLGQTEHSRTRLLVEFEAAGRRRDEAMASLANAFPPESGWRDELLGAPAPFVARVRAECEEYLARRTQLDQVVERLAQLEREGSTASHTDHAASALAEVKTAEAKERGDRVSALTEERVALVEGQPPEQAKAVLDSAVAAAESRRQMAEEAWRKASAAAAEAEGRRAEARMALEKAVTAQREAEAELRQGLARLGIADGRLRTLLDRDTAWVEARRSDLDRAGQEVREWTTRVDERSQALRQHQERDRPDLDGEAALDARAAADASLREGESLLAERKGLLAVDDDRRRKAAELLEKEQQQRTVVELWDRLDELIGSADGKKLRVFAQSLTLELLLDLANEHLHELAPRYRLERIPDADLEVQLVDREMGDEVRGANSLSGGESFLVSLALALGLSSLASRDTRIESLFIDEGFGSLDAHALDQAISVLDSLQASGSRVGLISHVSGLAERIGVQVRLRRCGGGRSELEVLGGG